jgi:hypothetical protein
MCSLLIEERWVSIPLEGVSMEKINLPLFYQLGMRLHPLTEMKPDAANIYRIAIASLWAGDTVEILLDRFPTLSVCRAAGNELLVARDEVLEWLDKTPAEKVKELYPSVSSIFEQVINKAKEFETVVSAELQKLDTYHATKKGIYDTTALIQQAENILPVSVLNKIDEDIAREIRESGKCLAFDCAAASGFHVVRAIEAVMHNYYIFVCKPASDKKLDNWGKYISAFHKLTEDTTAEKGIREDVKKVIALLQQIKDQDRNLIMHPEVMLTPDDAHKLFEIAEGAIIAMADRLPAPEKK